VDSQNYVILEHAHIMTAIGTTLLVSQQNP